MICLKQTLVRLIQFVYAGVKVANQTRVDQTTEPTPPGLSPYLAEFRTTMKFLNSFYLTWTSQ